VHEIIAQVRIPILDDITIGHGTLVPTKTQALSREHHRPMVTAYLPQPIQLYDSSVKTGRGTHCQTRRIPTGNPGTPGLHNVHRPNLTHHRPRRLDPVHFCSLEAQPFRRPRGFVPYAYYRLGRDTL
jgi:hypothetical protein